MIYRVVVHGPAPDARHAAAIATVESVLAAGGVEILAVTIHPDPDGRPVYHVETRLEAPSSYHAANVSGPELLSPLLADPAVGLEGTRLEFTAARYEDAPPA